VAGAKNLPVLVVGAGPVGQTAALLLARWGLPVVVLDARAARDPVGSRAIVQQRDVLDIWSAVGAGDRIAAEGVTWTTARTFYRDRELFTTRFVDRGASPLPAFVNISQARTEELLDEQIARRTDAIDVRWGHQAVDVVQDGRGVTVTCRTPDGEARVTGSHLVASGGGRGDELRRALGVSFDGASFTDPFLICDVRTDLGGWAHERRFCFDPAWNPGRQVLIHPCPDSTYRIDWQVAPGYDVEDEAASGALDRRIRTVIGDRTYRLVWRSVYRFHSRIADRMRVGRVLLAGDLAHLVAPFGARGLNSGVQDAENAAWKIAFARFGWGDEEALLASYQHERHAAARENLDVTTATMTFLVPPDAAAAARRHALLEAAVDDPQARSQVDSGRLAEPFWYCDSPLVTPDPLRPPTGRPPRGQMPVPGPGVLLPDLAVQVPGRPDVVRLRQLVRDGVLALVVPAIDDHQVAKAEAVRAALGGLAAPTSVLSVDALTPDGSAREAFGARPGEVWLVRPDGHVAAVLTEVADVAPAARRALGLVASAAPAPTRAG
jgi:pentachlorophenol monooxygenase/3-(3-hydroxy-phenyl)propionate hydroxylase